MDYSSSITSKNGSCPEDGSIQKLDVECYSLYYLLSLLQFVQVFSIGGNSVSIFNVLSNNRISCRSLAGCSFLGVGIKLSPLEGSDVFSGCQLISTHVDDDVGEGPLEHSLVFCLFHSWPWSFFTVLFFLFSSCVVSLDILSIMPCCLCPLYWGCL